MDSRCGHDMSLGGGQEESEDRDEESSRIATQKGAVEVGGCQVEESTTKFCDGCCFGVATGLH